MKNINSRQYLLGMAHTEEKMRSCHFIPNKVLYAVIFYDTQFY